jgi:hypothetical protein
MLYYPVPLTNPKSRYRIRRNGKHISASTKIIILENDILEWQILYSELEEILIKCIQEELVNKNDILEIINFAQNISENEFIEKNNEIIFEETNVEIKGFRKFFQKFPIFIKRGDYYSVEIAIKTRQIGTGLQSMIYVCVEMLKVYDYDGNPIINRKIRSKEKGRVLITKEMLIDILKAFSIASKKHNQDILKILNFEEGALSNK